MDKAKERFIENPEEFKVVFRPQCVECIKNIDREKCEAYEIKPIEYRKNEKNYPVFEEYN